MKFDIKRFSNILFVLLISNININKRNHQRVKKEGENTRRLTHIECLHNVFE